LVVVRRTEVACVGERFTAAGSTYQENLSIGVVKEIKLAVAVAVGRKCR
jgi:hypothetical protein